MTTQRLPDLIQAYLTDTISVRQGVELAALLKQPEYQEAFMKIIYEQLQKQELNIDEPPPVIFERIQNEIERQIRQETGKSASPEITNVIPIGFLHYRWRLVAAVVSFLLVAATYFLIQYGSKRQPLISDTSRHSIKDIPPGRQGAILTLSGGKKVVLDSMGNGVVATQNGVQVILKNGQLAYNPPIKHAGVIIYNTMSTPKGRQFQVMLPDGTQVWLNAESSIHYPTVFAGRERRVEINGEAYFEVVKNSKMPFKVKINGQAEVEVLGTHFNINAYQNEGVVKTTLLEGSVKITTGGLDKAVLQPGQQAQIVSSAKIKIIKDADIEKTMAWKYGVFNFDRAGLEEVMRQLSRWYDIDIVYEKGIPNVEFVGKLDKNVPLSDLLNGLKGFGIHFRIEGNKLVVFP